MHVFVVDQHFERRETTSKKKKQSMANPSEIATAFIQHYYQTLDTNPDALAGLYVC